MTKAEMARMMAIRDLCHNDFYFYSRYFFKLRHGFKWLRASHHHKICDAMTRVYRGECKRLIINIPPRYSKTELVVVCFTSWAFGKHPDCEFIHTSYSATLAVNNSQLSREIIESKEYSDIFPQTRIRKDYRGRKDWRTTEGGVFYATGDQGTITGYGAGKHRSGFSGALIIDDPHKADEARSSIRRKAVINRFQNTLESRLNSPETPIVLIMQRLHTEDLTGWLLSGGNGEQWEHLCLPALAPYEEGSELRALWPAKHSKRKLDQMNAANAYVFACQYQQRPYVLGGNIIRGAWFKLYALPPRIMYRAIYGDTAQKAEEANDYTVFQCWGYGEDNRIYLLDQVKGKWESPDLKKRCVAFWNKHKAIMRMGTLRALKIEDKSSGTGLIQDLGKESGIPIIGIPRSRDKYSRVLDVCDYIKAGHVCLPEGAPFLSDFIGECEEFTADDSHAHDDQVDAMVDAIKEMLADNKIQLWENII